MTTKRRIPTQQDTRDQGRCGHGYRPSDGNHCGKPSEPGAAFGDCPDHAREFREMGREVDRADPAYQSAERIERGDRVLAAERWENLRGGRSDYPEGLVREAAVKQRARHAERRPRERASR